MKYRKKPIIVEAEKKGIPGKVKTLEGDMSYEAGDYIVTGVKGERYPVREDIFLETYEPVKITTDKDPGLNSVCPKCGCSPAHEEYRHGCIYLSCIDQMLLICHGCAHQWTLDLVCWKEPEILEVKNDN